MLFAIGFAYAVAVQTKTMTSAEIDALWNIGDAVAGEKALDAALLSHPGSADEIHTQIARSLGLQRKFKEGWAELDKVSVKPSHIVEVRIQLESGRLKNTSGDRSGSAPYFERALSLAQKGGFDYYAVDAAHMLGIVTDGEASVHWHERAIAMADASKDARAQKWKGSLLNNMGWTYHTEGQFEKALHCFKEAVAFQDKHGSEQSARIARWTVARCLRSLKRYDEALAILNELIKFPEAGFVSEELGEDLLATGHPDEARPHFKKAYDLLSQDPDLKANDPKRLERLKELGGA